MRKLVAQMVRPAMQETRVQPLGQENLLEKEMATHFSILDWKIPWTEEPGRLQSMGCKESDTTEQLHFLFFLSVGKQTYQGNIKNMGQINLLKSQRYRWLPHDLFTAMSLHVLKLCHCFTGVMRKGNDKNT